VCVGVVGFFSFLLSGSGDDVSAFPVQVMTVFRYAYIKRNELFYSGAGCVQALEER